MVCDLQSFNDHGSKILFSEILFISECFFSAADGR